MARSGKDRGSPTAAHTLDILSVLGRHATPLPAATIAREVGLPRSTAYRVLAAMADRDFVVHLPDERRWGLGIAAFELGSAYAKQEPLRRVARPWLVALADRVGHSAHLVVLHGREVHYVIEERVPGRPSLVSDVGVRLPAPLTASGLAILAALPAAQVRALFPSSDAFVQRHDAGATSLSALRSELAGVRARGYAKELGLVTPGLASVGAAVLDHANRPVAAVAVTFPIPDVEQAGKDLAGSIAPLAIDCATAISGRLGGQR